MGRICRTNNESLVTITAYIILIVQQCYGLCDLTTICCGEVKPYERLIADRSRWQVLLEIGVPADANANEFADAATKTAQHSPCEVTIDSVSSTSTENRKSFLRCENSVISTVSTYSTREFHRSRDQSNQNGQTTHTSFNAIHLTNISFECLGMSKGNSAFTIRHCSESILNENTTEYLSWIKSNLNALDMDQLIGHNLQLFNNMKFLDLTDNNITYISKLFLSKLPNLRSMNLSGNSIDSGLLHKHVFGNLVELTQLDLSRNKLVSILAQNATNAVKRIYSRTSSNVYKEWNIFGDGTQLKLEHLDLSDNMIADLPRNAFDGMRSLRCLDMARNQLAVTPFQAFNALVNVESINLAHNKLVSVLDNYFVGNKALRMLQLQDNAIERLTQYSLHGLDNLQHLDIANNQLMFIDRNALRGLHELRILNLSGNRFKSIPTTLFTALTNLQQLHLSENHFATLPDGVFTSQYKLEQLMMDNTLIETIGNVISRQPGHIDKTILAQLRHVSISNNLHLHEIKSITLLNMPSVEYLNLSSNKLQSLPVELAEMQRLRELDISQNDLTSIPKELMKLKHLQSLDLLGNNYACDCHMYWLTHWLESLHASVGGHNASLADLPPPLNQVNHLKCRHGYPGDMILVLQQLHCTKPIVRHVSDNRMHMLRNEAMLECNFAGNPAPDITWVTPTNQIIQHSSEPDVKLSHTQNVKDSGGNFGLPNLLSVSRMFSSDEPVPGYSLLDNGTLRIHNISREDSGLYTCYGHNIMGYSTANIR